MEDLKELEAPLRCDKRAARWTASRSKPARGSWCSTRRPSATPSRRTSRNN